MKTQVIAFDLDGTLSDPASGIQASINHALEDLGRPPAPPGELDQYIGIPLRDIFERLLGPTGESAINRAVDAYRDHYMRTGFSENTLYPQIPLLLERLGSLPVRLYVTTLKTPRIARRVIEHFGLQDHFVEILGCGSDRRKADLLEQIRRMETGAQFLMVGDRHEDMRAGQQAGFLCVGVLWGYGSRRELLDHGADHLIGSPLELMKLL